MESWLAWLSAVMWITVCSRFAAAPGPSFTSAWLFIGVQAILWNSDDAFQLFYTIGSSLNVGWYGLQFLDKSAWSKIMNIWTPQFPLVPRNWLSTAVRCFDLVMHALPLLLATGWCTQIRLKHVLQAAAFDRAYFLATDGLFVGDGRVVNHVYQVRPRAPPRFYYTLQGLSVLGRWMAMGLCSLGVKANSTLKVFYFIIALGMIQSHTQELIQHHGSYMKRVAGMDEKLLGIESIATVESNN